ncbi:MAG: hypothetical protein P8Z81_07505 [Deinococcales bacterium]|jgi:hypothetical protein
MGSRRWWPVAAALLAQLALAGSTAGPVAGMRFGGVAYAPAAALARALGDILVPGQGSLTWRSARGTLTVFDGSPDALWQPVGDASAHTLGLSAPAMERSGSWWLPLDALDTLGVAVSGNELTLPGGSRLELVLPPLPASGGEGRAQVDDLGHGVPALRLFASGEVSAMLTDLDMLALVDPAQRADIDATLQKSGQDKPLLVVVTALASSPWQASFTLQQGDRSLEFRYPYRMRLVEGSTERVGPSTPAAVLLLLPVWFDLYAPIRVSWQGVTGSVTFRR